MPNLFHPKEVQFKDLFNALKSKYFAMLFGIGVFQALVGYLNERLQDIEQVFIIVGRALREYGLHAGVEDLNVVLSLCLQLLLAEQVSVVIKTVVF